ncbi:E3 ubiquitin-protein like [Actinidia chinensis var. chinensis]|uniref:E3 ubiquitin-protein like n=1 Tax=Actinidia chinensis var. chinensis TaxID=1590841 RepID=A0A2R6R963_ACTCC|nr:E3 ubiquitin-protein like [Actinidia chinensis var. chinensis]
MDDADFDQGCDVPDTPDRLATQNINGRGLMEKESDSSVATNQLIRRNKLVMDNGHSRSLPFHTGKKLSISNKFYSGGDMKTSLGNPSSSKNGHLFRRKVAEKTANHENRYSAHSQRAEKGKSLCNSQSSTWGKNGVVDLTVQSGLAQVLEKAFPNRTSDSLRAKEVRNGPISTNGFSSALGIANSLTIAHDAYKGKEKIDDACKGSPGIDSGKRIFYDSQPKTGKELCASFQSIPPPRVSGQKKLVRNGCISQNNKAKHLAENQSNGSTDARNAKGHLESDSSSSLIRELVAEDSSSHRGKGVMSYLFSSKRHGTKPIDLSTRHSMTQNEEASGTSNANGDAFGCFEGRNGWRSTHNNAQKISLSLSDEAQYLPWTKIDSREENGNGSSIRIGDDYIDDRDTVSLQHGSPLNVSRTSKLDQVGGHHAAASPLIKRQKRGSASSNHGETSTSTSADSEIVFLGSSGEPLNSRSTRNQNSHGRGILDPVIEIDEFSPERRRGGTHNTVHSINSDSDAKARQLEADEMLARELQEELYNEGPGVRDGEIDAHIALALQQEESSRHVFSRSQSRSSHNSSVRRGTQARGRSSSRLARLRGQLPRQSPRISLGERSSIFPPDMDLDMRVHVLEALEAFSDMGVTGNFLPVEREFNEYDYETLLALDENNHQHGGASLNQINILPESTVQGDNFEEACAICLETPTSGDTIRHLPCLHKFHKDCIDPWLRRRTSCPVCKSSIT